VRHWLAGSEGSHSSLFQLLLVSREARHSVNRKPKPGGYQFMLLAHTIPDGQSRLVVHPYQLWSSVPDVQGAPPVPH
jgi:hypothetical protein